MGIGPFTTSPNRDIVAEASAWFVEFRERDVPTNTRTRFDEWLRRSPEHIQAYLEVSAAWSELPTTDPEGRIDVDALLEHARAAPEDNVIELGGAGNTNPESHEARRQGRLSQRFLRALPLFPAFRLALGASLTCFVALIALGAWLVFFRADTYNTGLGEQRTLRLIDGSTIELNALSRVQVRFRKDIRDIELTSGQAFFHVAKDPTRPFIVHGGAATVRALGTQFDVYRKASGTTVTVLEGQVAVLPAGAIDRGAVAPDVRVNTRQWGATPASTDRASPRAGPVFLEAGEQVTVTPSEVLKPRKADVKAAAAWVQQRLIFESTSLTEVASEFNRYNIRKLVITDPALGALGISGVYSLADPGTFIEFLRAQPNLQVTESATEVQVSRRRQ
jgi:transmembrane sensor